MYSEAQAKSLDLIRLLLKDGDRESLISDIKSIKILDSLSIDEYFSGFDALFQQNFSPKSITNPSVIIDKKARVDVSDIENVFASLIKESIKESFISFSSIKIQNSTKVDKILIDSELFNDFDNFEGDTELVSGNASYAMAA